MMTRLSAIAALGFAMPILAQAQTPSPDVLVSRLSGHDRSQRLAAGVEQNTHGTRPPVAVIASFDGLGSGFVGPQGPAVMRNPSDNTLAVGPNHIVEIVNSRMAIYTKKGAVYDTTGKVILGPEPTNVLFKGFGGRCEPRPNGDAVVRWDQIARRWLFVMPIFRRDSADTNEPFSMCYALSVGEDPLGPYHRYEFKRKLFPDYPRPAIWLDGYYVPTSTGDDVIEKHACVVERDKMLWGGPATEQCIIIRDVNFLNNADIDGLALPPAGSPNIMMAAGGTQLRRDFNDDGIYYWKMFVDWKTPGNTRVDGPHKITVAPYNYLCDGQLTRCVPQPGTEMRLDAQGDKLMSRLVYRNVNGRESIVGLHSVNTEAGAGGVRWYEFRLDASGTPVLHQQSTYAPDGSYRWMGSIAMDRVGNIGIGYSFGGTPHFAGQRFAARLANDSLNQLTFKETVLVEGKAAQTNTLRWEDYTTTAMDPDDDCTIWYVGDYLKANAQNYTTRIGAFRIPGCLQGSVRGSAFFDIDRDGHHDLGEPGIPGVQIAYSGGESGMLDTDAAGAYTITLPADPVYGRTTYSFTRRTGIPRGWTASPRRTDGRRSVTATPTTFTVRLNDRDEVKLDFGSFCSATNANGAPVSFWTGSEGEGVLTGRNPAWRRQFAMQLNLVDAEGTRFTLPDSVRDAYPRFKAFLEGSSARAPAYHTSVQLAATAFNVAFGKQDGGVAVHDPVVNDWVTVSALVTRVSNLIAANSKATSASAAGTNLLKYRTTLLALNNNTAVITPSSPTGCTR